MASPFDTATRYLIRDGDGVYGPRVTRRIESPGIDEVITEFGVAYLRGLTVCEQARALLGISSPRFRDELRQAAERLV